MGRYLRKTKATGEVSLMEVVAPFCGVLTRARTLALQRKSTQTKASRVSRRKEEKDEEEVDSTTQRNVRETTPCSVILDSHKLGTPDPVLRPASSNTSNRRLRSHASMKTPTTLETEEFFAAAEQQQHRTFIEKYNFDPVNDCPLPGRYEWVAMNS